MPYNHTQEEVTQYLEVCKKYNLLITGGSDFHGDVYHPQKLGVLMLEEDVCHQFLSSKTMIDGFA